MFSIGATNEVPLRLPVHLTFVSQDARRPFQNGGGLVSEPEYGLGGWAEDPYRYEAAREADDVGFDKGTIEERSIIDQLKKSGEDRQQGFFDRLKFWQTHDPTRVDVTPEVNQANFV
jgi:hypothetical protein